MKIDLIYLDSFSYPWNISKGWVQTLERMKLLGQAFFVNESTYEIVFQELKKSKSDLVILIGGDHYLPFLHDEPQKRDFWQSLKQTTVCLCWETIINAKFPNTIEKSSSARLCFDYFICSDERDLSFFNNQNNICFAPVCVDEQSFKVKLPIQERPKQMFFFGQITNFNIPGVYDQRRELLQQLLAARAVVFVNGWIETHNSPDVLVNLYNNFYSVINLPTNMGGYTQRVFEAMSCGTTLLQYRLESQPICSSLFVEYEDYIPYDITNFSKLLHTVQNLNNLFDLEKITKQAREKILQYHTIEKRIQQIIKFVQDGEKIEYQILPELKNTNISSNLSQLTLSYTQTKSQTCKVCGSDSHYFSTAKILQKYDVDYFQCSNCGFVQTEHPYWLNEAYSEAITNSDVGLVYRNNMMANIAAKLLFNYFDHEAKFLDYGGGYGLLVRLMRDQGFNFYWYDKFCKNLFATGFELTENIKSDLLLVTAFELFEHFTYPLQELEEMLKLAPNILFSTSLLPENNPQPDQWWYYTPHEGQHISIYTRKSLEVLAEKYNLKLYTDGNSLHLLTTNKNLPENLFEAVISGKLPSSEKQSLLSHDFNQVVSQILAKNSALNVNESVNITELKPPIILIDGVFFQLLKTGIARVWRSLLQEWANTEFANHILVLDRANTAPKINGIRYRTIPPYDYNNTAADKQMLQQICNEEGADLFISSYYTTPITTPSVFMAYDMIPEVLGANLNEPMWREKHHAIKHASAYIAISQNTARDLSRYFPNIAVESITVAHCGVSNTFSPANPLQINTFKHRYGINKPYFLLAGNLADYKNQILFLKAFSKLPNSYEFDIIFTGFGGVFPPELRDYTSGSAVHQLRLSDEELAIAYSGAVALVYPSKYEGFGMPIVEAMACGCPVITCHNSSMPEVAGEAAIYVKENDVDAMANALTSVQNHNLRASLITAGLAQAQKFSWTKMADKVSSALINATLLSLKLRDINLIIFPDPTQPEQSIYQDLINVITALEEHPHSDNITLLINASNFPSQFTQAFMDNLCTQDEEETAGLEISLVGKLSPMQWESLLPQLTARIVLTQEDQQTLEQLPINQLQSCEVESLNYQLSILLTESLKQNLRLRDINLIIFPEPTQSEQSIYQDLINVITALEEHPDSDNITLLINASNFPSQFTQAFMDNLCNQDEEETAGLEISLVGKLSPMQWESLLPQLSARIVLNNEDQQALEQVQLENLTSYQLDNLDNQQF
ncbi:glycosyltransferase [Sphaerospermopsis sp. FACHB-1194]|uniref:glycosyltransferase n=1 Tax=Sphaerospermopsis sp. FACHB-1194 TaxID=2692862 RepID=UPI001680EEE0|nr:glycosyltransferase [Sphaerospermopsis sp. FACHB-1194]MBD2148115.1 glycosyltransferase [Sphaerospermopsis sp. FACHB-1194]